MSVCLNTPTNDRLQEFETLVPHIVGSHNEVSNRIAGITQQLSEAQNKMQQEIRQDIFKLNQHVHQLQSDLSRRIDQVDYCLQQLLNLQQLILSNLHFLANQRLEAVASTSLVSLPANSHPLVHLFPAPSASPVLLAPARTPATSNGSYIKNRAKIYTKKKTIKV